VDKSARCVREANLDLVLGHLVLAVQDVPNRMAADDGELCAALQRKLQRWQQLGEAPEYYALRNRGPFKPTVVHALNRFGGQMGPYEDSLLRLRSVEYINASPIDNLGSGVPRFAATMCPKQQTFAHFWSMVWELGSTVIVNLTHMRDRVGSAATDKRERYWPPFDEAMTKQALRWPVQVRTCGCEACEQVPGLQRFAVELSGPSADGARRSQRVVALYWYSRWVDFPSSASIGSRPFFANAWAVLHMALHVAQLLERCGDEHWGVCHCSAGVGRTGTFVALVTLLRRLLGSQHEAALDSRITTVIESMRARRLWMVKTDIECALATRPRRAPARARAWCASLTRPSLHQVRHALRRTAAALAQPAR
jgi:protein tyrosine phosphatase